MNYFNLYGLLLQAVCCDDHEHCCPNGDTCDVAEGKCNKQNGESIPWSRKVKAISKVSCLNNYRSIFSVNYVCIAMFILIHFVCV